MNSELVSCAESTDLIYEDFVNCLKNKIPQNSVLVTTISDLLRIEKDAVYRRLRGDVPFTFAEIAIICNGMGISLDRYTNHTSDRNKLFQMRQHDYFNLSDYDYQSLENYNKILETAKSIPNTEFAECSNMFPISIYLNYHYLTKYYLFRWGYQNKRDTMKPFCEIDIPKRLAKIYKDFLNHTKHVSLTFFLWDRLIFQNLVNEINYYKEIDLISKSEAGQIREDLFRLLEDVRNLCMKGGYEETGNYVHIYISDTYHETICSCLDASNVKVSMFKLFTLNYIVSLDHVVYDVLKKWIKSLLRTSTVISTSNEKERNAFFDRQYDIINSL